MHWEVETGLAEDRGDVVVTVMLPCDTCVWEVAGIQESEDNACSQTRGVSVTCLLKAWQAVIHEMWS